MSLRDKLVKLRHGSFARSVLVLAGGTALAQAVSVLVLPIITRIYSPSDFRVFAVYIASVQLIAVAACLRLEVAIPLPESDEDAANVLCLALSSAFVISIATAAVLWLLPNFVVKLTGASALKPFLLLIPLGVLATALYSALQYWATRKRRFPIVARTRMAQSVAGAIAQICLGLLKFAPLGLLVGNILQSGAGVTSLAKNMHAQDRELFYHVSARNMRRMWCQYIYFPRYSVGEAVAHMGSMQLPIIIIATLPIGPEAGFLSLAMRVMQAPIGLIGAAVAQVFSASAAEAFRRNSLSTLTARTFGGLLKSAVGPMIFLGVLAPAVFAIVFGHKWVRAGELVRWMTPLFIAQLMASPIGSVLYVTQHQRRALGLHIFGVIFRVSAVLTSAALASKWVSEVYACSGFLFYALYMTVSLRTAATRRSEMLGELRSGSRYVAAWLVAAIFAHIVLTHFHFTT